MGRKFSSIQAAVAAIARGEVVIVVDAEDRENEGDFICAAETVTPEVVNFILSGNLAFNFPELRTANRTHFELGAGATVTANRLQSLGSTRLKLAPGSTLQANQLPMLRGMVIEQETGDTQVSAFATSPETSEAG